MKLGEHLDAELVIADMQASSKEEALAELVSPLADRGVDVEFARTVLAEREQLGTTGIGEGVAIPHGKIAGLNEVRMVVGRSLSGIDFESLDKEPCKIFFMVLAPENAAGIHLRLLAHISRLLKDMTFRDRFLQAESPDDLWELVKNI